MRQQAGSRITVSSSHFPCSSRLFVNLKYVRNYMATYLLLLLWLPLATLFRSKPRQKSLATGFVPTTRRGATEHDHDITSSNTEKQQQLQPQLHTDAQQWYWLREQPTERKLLHGRSSDNYDRARTAERATAGELDECSSHENVASMLRLQAALSKTLCTLHSTFQAEAAGL
jgi:hypothetical protein